MALHDELVQHLSAIYRDLDEQEREDDNPNVWPLAIATICYEFQCEPGDVRVARAYLPC